jgi:hypothetical protein
VTIWEGFTYALDGEGAAVVTGEGSTKVVMSEDAVAVSTESAAMRIAMDTYNDQQSKLLRLERSKRKKDYDRPLQARETLTSAVNR